MKLLFSVPSGYHIRELVLPLRVHLESHTDISEVHIVTPAFTEVSTSAKASADKSADKPASVFIKDIFPDFGSKFIFHENPTDDAGHKELFSKIQPDRVITNTVGHDALDEPILRNAKEMGIATVTFIASWDNVWKIERLMHANIPIAIADRFIVWNTMMKEHLMRIFPEVAETRIAIIGAPRLDYFSEQEKIASKEEVYKRFGFEDISRPFIHIATTELYPMEYLVKTIKEGIDTGAIPNNPYLYASVHPGGSLEKYKEFEKYGVTVRFSPGRKEDISLPAFRYAPTDADIFFLLGVFTHAKLLINHSSTVALESLIAGVPVINVKYGMTLDWWNWYRSMVYRDFNQHYKDLVSDLPAEASAKVGGATYVVKSKKELLTASADALTNPHKKDAARNVTVQKMITTTDGTASKKVLDFIIAL